MDYLVCSALRDIDSNVTLAYDIACQYSVHFWRRVKDNIPEDMQPRFANNQLEFFVGAMHVHGHTSSCQGAWAGAYRPGNARTPGDNIEHGWPELNVLAGSTLRMGPGSRSDLIDVACLFWNHQKTIGLGESSLQRVWIVLTVNQVLNLQGTSTSLLTMHARALQPSTRSITLSRPRPLICSSHGSTKL